MKKLLQKIKIKLEREEGIKSMKFTLNAYMWVQGRGVEKLVIKCICIKWMVLYL